MGLPDKLVLEQHSFTVADFCCLLTHLPGSLGARGACSKALVLEQHSLTFEETTEGAATFVLALNTAHVLALNTAYVLRLNKADVLALNMAHVFRLSTKICPVFTANTEEGGGLRPSPCERVLLPN